MLSDDLIGSSANRPGVVKEYESLTQRACGRMTVHMRRNNGFQINAVQYRAAGYNLARVITVAGKTQLIRNAADVACDHREDYDLLLPLAGSQEVSHNHHQVVCKPGTAAFVARFEPIIQTKLENSHDSLYFVMPREFVDQRLVASERIFPKVQATTQGLWPLALDTLHALHRNARGLKADQFAAAARIACELVVLALGGQADVGSNCPSIRTSNLARVKHAITREFNNPEITLSAVAEECGISLRYLHQLFRDDHLSAAQYLKAQRLSRARQLFCNADVKRTTVTGVAEACGYTNLSQFSTAFKRAFGLSPKEALHQREH